MRTFGDLNRLPPIREFADLQTYWDAYLHEFIPLQGPLIPSLARVLRAVDVQDTLVAIRSLPENEGTEWHKNESLRYSTRYLYATDRPVGDVRDALGYSTEDSQLGKKALIHLGHMSLVRDHIESVRVGISSVEIDSSRRVIRFYDQPETITDIQRREYNSLQEAQRRALRSESDQDPRSEDVALAEAIREEIKEPHLIFGSSAQEERITELFIRFHSVINAATANDPWLPDDVDLGCYTAGQFRAFNDEFLWAWAMMHESLMGRVVEMMPTLPIFVPPDVMALMMTSIDYVVSQATRMIGLDERVAREIARDLTYSTDAQNPTPFLHPLLPIGGGKVFTIPRLIHGANWIGRLLRILERAPWRSEARRLFGEQRESLMQDRLEQGMSSLSVQTRRNIKVGPRSARIGDIDLLVFAPDSSLGMALSLKWYYPPNLVQEVASQAARLNDAVRKHIHVVEAFRSDYERIRSSYDLPSEVVFRPVVVVQPGPVFERSRSADVAVLTGTEFLKLAGESSSLGDFIRKVAAYEAPRIEVVPSERKVHLAKYTFGLPSYYIPKSELERLGFLKEPEAPRIPWDLEALRRGEPYR